MSLNLWTCQARNCSSKSVGTGGALGLRAIGWFVQYIQGQQCIIFCPAHRPDGYPECKELSGEEAPRPCPHCKADDEAQSIQEDLLKRFPRIVLKQF